MLKCKINNLEFGRAEIGAGLHWDNCSQNLYFVDLYGPIIYRYDSIQNLIYKATVENETTSSFIIPIQDKPNEFAVGLSNHVGIIEWDGIEPICKVTSILIQVEIPYCHNRFNEAKADPLGRFVGGTMRSERAGNIFDVRHGKLYKLDKQGQKPVIIKDNVAVPSGLAWNSKTDKFYFIDACDYNIKEYDYCKTTGLISNPKVLREFRCNENERPSSLPYGIAIDTKGYLYVPGNGGSVINKINPETGEIDDKIDMPTAQITSVAFGGPSLDILYATSSTDGCKIAPAGETFEISGLGVTGLPMNNLRI